MDLPPEIKGMEREIKEKLDEKKLNVNFTITSFTPDGGLITYDLSSKNPDKMTPKEAQAIVDKYFKETRRNPINRRGFRW